MEGGIHGGLYDPNTRIIAPNFPVPILPSGQPTRHGRVHGKSLRQWFPQRLQIKGTKQLVFLVLVVEYDVESVLTHGMVQSRQGMGLTRLD